MTTWVLPLAVLALLATDVRAENPAVAIQVGAGQLRGRWARQIVRAVVNAEGQSRAGSSTPSGATNALLVPTFSSPRRAAAQPGFVRRRQTGNHGRRNTRMAGL